MEGRIEGRIEGWSGSEDGRMGSQSMGIVRGMGYVGWMGMGYVGWMGMGYMEWMGMGYVGWMGMGYVGWMGMGYVRCVHMYVWGGRICVEWMCIKR